MDPPDANDLHAELVAAFFHPPRIVDCRYEVRVDDEVLIVSHTELWPWRTVIRGSVTRPGLIGHNEGIAHVDGAQRTAAWLHRWSMEDDVGTEYHSAGAGMGGDGFCQDLHAEFRPAVPSAATRLTISTPNNQRIDVAL